MTQAGRTLRSPFERETWDGIPVDDGGATADAWVFRRAPLDGPAKGRIVLTHGLGDAPVTWFPCLRDAFAEHELCLPALPGAGRGPLPAGVDHLPFSQTQRWVQEVLSELVTDHIPTTLIGHSLGGWLMSRSVLQERRLRETARAPILINTAGTWYPGVERERALLSPRQWEDVDELLGYIYAEPPELPIEALDAMYRTMRSPAYKSLLWSTTEADFLKPEHLRELPNGTGLVWGTADRLVPTEAFERLKEHVPDARIETLDRVGHAPHLEAPERLIQTLEHMVA